MLNGDFTISFFPTNDMNLNDIQAIRNIGNVKMLQSASFLHTHFFQCFSLKIEHPQQGVFRNRVF